MGNRQSSHSLPVEPETANSNKRISLIAREFDVGKEFEHDEMQPEKRQRRIDEQNMVIYGQEQGSSSNSQLTCHLDWLANNSSVYPRIVTLKEKLDRLFARQCDVLTELEHAEIQPGQKQREEVRHWLTEVQRKKDKIRSMIKDVQGTSSNSNLSVSIESFIKEVDELNQRSQFSNGLVLVDQETTRLPLSLGIKTVGTDFQQNTKKILEWLQSHQHCIIGVYGMGGVGKTTLLMCVHDQLLQDSNLSGHVYWVTVSQNCPVRRLQDDIAKVLGLSSFHEDDERKRAAILHRSITARGRIVLILDDMWEQVSGSKVGIPLENSKCKIILSTRVYDVCRKMGCKDFVIKAETLHEGEAWDLFVEKLGHYATLEEEAKKLAWDIAKECGGLPLAIATMARSLTDVVDTNEWKTALNGLKSARDQADMKEDVFRILRYSYDRLSDKKVQECFLSCILYDEDVEIRRTELIDLWINDGLLDEEESRDAQIAKGHVILNKLESSCLLESLLTYGVGKIVKMHDLIRDMGIIITKEHSLFIAEARKGLKQVPEEEKWSKNLTKVSLIHNKIVEIPSGMAPMTPNLTVLMLKANPLRKIPNSFFVHMRALTVLDLSATWIKRVPKSVSYLENLRGLMLSNCGVLKYVPSVAKLRKLRILDLANCDELTETPRGLEKLNCVEEVSYIPWDVSDMIGFNEVIRSLTSLSFSKIYIRDPTLFGSLDEEWEDLILRDQKVVCIAGGEFGENKGICLLPTTVEVLLITQCDMEGRCLGDVFPTLSEAKGVKTISIRDCRGLESISGSLGTQQGSFVLYTNQLEGLELIGLPDLRSIAKVGVPHSFCHLRYLRIYCCQKLKAAFPMTCTNQLHLLKLFSIDVRECEGLEEILESNKAILSKPLVVLPELRRMELYDLPKIKVIFPLAEQLQLPPLREINVEKCEELEEILGSNKATLTSNPFRSLNLCFLEKLFLKDLPNIKVIFAFTEALHLPVLRKIEVAECDKVEGIFESNKITATPFKPIICLPDLKELVLIKLPELGCIYRGLLRCISITPKLVRIEDCPKLKLWRLLPEGDLTSDEAACSIMEFPPQYSSFRS